MSLYTPEVKRAHECAMSAKELVFQAQDATSLIKLPRTSGAGPSRGLRATQALQNGMNRELTKARNALEALDRLCRDAQRTDQGDFT